MSDLRQKFKSVSTGAIGLLVMVGLFVLALFVIRGVVWLSDKVLPVLADASMIAVILCCILIFLPLSFFRKTRGFAAICYYICSFVFGATLWTYSCLISVELWGYGALVFGLILACPC
jgi:hypothetical protein